MGTSINAVGIEGAEHESTGGHGQTFDARFAVLFDAHFQRVFRVLDRLSGDPDLAADLAQNAFVKLFRRGSEPDRPEAWLITVAMNLFRNVKTGHRVRARLLTSARAARAHGDVPRSAAVHVESEETRGLVRAALERIGERDRAMLVLRAEGYRYREIADALDIEEASVGKMLARAKTAFREAYEVVTNAR